MSSRGMEEQLTRTKALDRRGLAWWMAWANSSFPTPLPPRRFQGQALGLLDGGARPDDVVEGVPGGAQVLQFPLIVLELGLQEVELLGQLGDLGHVPEPDLANGPDDLPPLVP